MRMQPQRKITRRVLEMDKQFLKGISTGQHLFSFSSCCPLCSAKNWQEFTNKLSSCAEWLHVHRRRGSASCWISAPTWARSSWPCPFWWGAGARESQSGAAAERPAWVRDVSRHVWAEAGGCGRRTTAWWRGTRLGHCSLNTWRCTLRRPRPRSASPDRFPGKHRKQKSSEPQTTRDPAEQVIIGSSCQQMCL